jgi:peroxiredoxin
VARPTIAIADEPAAESPLGRLVQFWWLGLVVIVLGALFLVLKPSFVTHPAPSGSPNPANRTNLSAAPDFQLTTLEGPPFRLSDQKGKPVILYFMAAWCSSCVPEAQSLDQLHRHYADRGLQVVAIDVDTSDGPADLAQLRRAIPEARYLWALDTGGEVTLAYQVRELDTKVLIDQAGRVVYHGTLPTNYGALLLALEGLFE